MPQPHFILMPLMAQGHQIPMVDMARLLASHDVIVTIVTTPQNSLRFSPIIERAVESGLKIRILRLRFPAAEAGLPEGCESLDAVPSRDLDVNFMKATALLSLELEQFIAEQRPSCMVSDRYLPWTSKVAHKFGIPRLVFDGTSCFNFVCSHNIRVSKIFEMVSELEMFLVPNLPHQIEVNRAQLPNTIGSESEFVRDIQRQIEEADETAYGLLINTFEDLESEYLKKARKIVKRVWAIGPLSACNKDDVDISRRGNKSAVATDEVSRWLDAWPAGSVIYACFGTLGVLDPNQMLEIGLALEASNRPFVWVLKGGGERTILENGLEGRTNTRGLFIRGWAPQVLILGHVAVGGFLTHCGWNSTMEGLCAGVPMLTWPMFSDQFFNERFVTDVVRVGVRVGVERSMGRGGEESDDVAFLKSNEDIGMGIERVMGLGEGQEEMRKRAKEIADKAKNAVATLPTLIQHLMQHLNTTIYN